MGRVIRPVYQLARDFAGPLATVLAACVAAYFVRQQLSISGRVALDQLRLGLFDRRFAIYGGMRDMIRSALNDASNPVSFIEYYVMIREARFLFSGETCRWLDDLEKDVQGYIKAVAAPNYSQMEVIGSRLIERSEELQSRFQSELGFDQLTSRL